MGTRGPNQNLQKKPDTFCLEDVSFDAVTPPQRHGGTCVTTVALKNGG